jgi:hypothetical protein
MTDEELSVLDMKLPVSQRGNCFLFQVSNIGQVRVTSRTIYSTIPQGKWLKGYSGTARISPITPFSLKN